MEKTLPFADKKGKFGVWNKNSKKPIRNYSFVEVSGEESTYSLKDIEHEEHEIVSAERKEKIADFISNHPESIGNANQSQQKHVLVILRRDLRIQGQELNQLINDYPQLLTISPRQFVLALDNWKRQGIRDLKSHLLERVTDLLLYCGPNSELGNVRRDFDHIILNYEQMAQRNKLKQSQSNDKAKQLEATQ
ncbi:hypothetical protein RFI_23026 [Reticulomyxa filosa]|uniref:Uncharacterized protein n=1 Tax=Reticulomyxa filosa TaxID=46433 RepID=X6MLL6_RETFI|nr:hypothetical protein RFI_23026 [Reticulomyxa filosa]|eukprot:ETO14342.1 hypothetical protein RFI_23026 [Reticulomyxa filosa]